MMMIMLIFDLMMRSLGSTSATFLGWSRMVVDSLPSASGLIVAAHPWSICLCRDTVYSSPEIVGLKLMARIFSGWVVTCALAASGFTQQLNLANRPADQSTNERPVFVLFFWTKTNANKLSNGRQSFHCFLSVPFSNLTYLLHTYTKDRTRA